MPFYSTFRLYRLLVGNYGHKKEYCMKVMGGVVSWVIANIIGNYLGFVPYVFKLLGKHVQIIAP